MNFVLNRHGESVDAGQQVPSCDFALPCELTPEEAMELQREAFKDGLMLEAIRQARMEGVAEGRKSSSSTSGKEAIRAIFSGHQEAASILSRACAAAWSSGVLTLQQAATLAKKSERRIRQIAEGSFHIPTE